MTFEKPQKGNPYRLTIRQHIFPRASIARFANSSGRVHVHKVNANRSFLAAPDNALFCAKRVWDQRAEDSFANKIERPFQRLANAIVEGAILALGESEKKTINLFYALCLIRAEWKSIRVSNHQIPGAVGFQYETSKDLQEKLEARHIICFGPDLTFPGRSSAGVVMQSRINQLQNELSDTDWCILRAQRGEFLVADNFSCWRVIPISPVLCLAPGSNHGVISEAEVAWLNRQAIAISRAYYFARDLSRCPRADR
jgi:hypothetical protein